MVCRGSEVFAPGVEQRGAVRFEGVGLPRSCGEAATADRIRVQKTVPEYLEGKGNGPFCGVNVADIWAIRGWRATGISGSGD